MNKWGRDRKKSDTPPGYRFFAFGAAFIVFALAVFSFGGIGDGEGSVLRREEVAAAALIVGADAVPEETEEPPGYLNGKWNLWEYIGDALASAVRRK